MAISWRHVSGHTVLGSYPHAMRNGCKATIACFLGQLAALGFTPLAAAAPWYRPDVSFPAAPPAAAAVHRAGQLFGEVQDGVVSISSTDTGKQHTWTYRQYNSNSNQVYLHALTGAHVGGLAWPTTVTRQLMLAWQFGECGASPCNSYPHEQIRMGCKGRVE